MATTQAVVCSSLQLPQLACLLDETFLGMRQLANMTICVVNSAGCCGFTSRYQGYEALHANDPKLGLVVSSIFLVKFNKHQLDSAKKKTDFFVNTLIAKFPIMRNKLVSVAAKFAFHKRLKKLTHLSDWHLHSTRFDASNMMFAVFASEVKPDGPMLVGTADEAMH